MDTLSIAVRILQVGFSGFAFLLAYLSYRLLRSEQARDSVRTEIINSVRWYMKWAFALAILVSVMSTSEMVLRPFLSKPLVLEAQRRQQVSECERRLVILAALSEDPKATVRSLQAAVEGYGTLCQPILQELAK